MERGVEVKDPMIGSETETCGEKGRTRLTWRLSCSNSVMLGRTANVNLERSKARLRGDSILGWHRLIMPSIYRRCRPTSGLV